MHVRVYSTAEKLYAFISGLHATTTLVFMHKYTIRFQTHRCIIVSADAAAAARLRRRMVLANVLDSSAAAAYKTYINMHAYQCHNFTTSPTHSVDARDAARLVHRSVAREGEYQPKTIVCPIRMLVFADCSRLLLLTANCDMYNKKNIDAYYEFDSAEYSFGSAISAMCLQCASACMRVYVYECELEIHFRST